MFYVVVFFVFWGFFALRIIIIFFQRRVTHHDNHAYEHSNGNAQGTSNYDRRRSFLHNGFHHLNETAVTELVDDTRNAEEAISDDRKGESSTTSEIVNCVKQQLSLLSNIEHIIRKKRKMAESVEEWQTMAQIMDRVFLVFFALVSLISSLTFLINSYMQDDD